MPTFRWLLWCFDKSMQTWTKYPCTMDMPVIQNNGAEPLKYRIVANVTDITDLRIDHSILAYYGTDDSYNLLDKEIAEKILNELGGSDNDTSCWVFVPRSKEQPQVSLKPIFPDSSTYLVWFTTIIAVCSGLFLFFSVISRISDRIYELTNSGNHTFRNIRNLHQAPANVAQPSNRPRCLTIRQTRFVCNVFSREWHPLQEEPDDASDWICSICLDGPDANTQRLIRTVLLPCTHRFHRGCIRHWLRKGKPACPLCQWDARQLFNEDGEPTQFIVGSSGTADTAAPLQCVAVVRDDNVENGLTLPAADHERFTQGVASWQYLNDEDSMSSIRTPQPPSGRLWNSVRLNKFFCCTHIQ